jgi:hypothetical protein
MMGLLKTEDYDSSRLYVGCIHNGVEDSCGLNLLLYCRYQTVVLSGIEVLTDFADKCIYTIYVYTSRFLEE